MAAKRKTANRTLALLLGLVLCLGPVWSVEARAAGGTGLTVERVYLREILRSYAADRTAFDTDNGAQALAELFTATVGLNYYGEGNPNSYFAKDITGKYGSDPYVEDNLLGSYEVDIRPVNGRAEAAPAGATCTIHVYRAGYTPLATGAVPVYHYVWQDNGSWWAVRDDVPYYRVSFDGMNAVQAQSAGVQLMWARANGTGTDNVGGWSALTGSAAAMAHGAGGTMLALEGGAAVFSAVSGGETVEVSDFVSGSYASGPLVDSRSICRSDGGPLSDQEELEADTAYRVRIVFSEALRAAAKGGVVSVTAVREESGESCTVENVVWYGSEEHLTNDDYNPQAVEFTVTAAAGRGDCLFTLQGVVGNDTGLCPAVFRQRAEQSAPAATATPEPTSAPTPTAEPAATAAPELTPAPTEVPVAFDPETLVTWGDMALRLWQRQGCPDVVNEPGQTQQYRALCWAESAGLCEIWADGSLTAEAALTREQTALVLYRYAQLDGAAAAADEDISTRPDYATVSLWAVEAVQWAVGSGILTPAMDGAIAPGATISHGQLDWMLENL